jgi:hypothetical protein
MKTAGMPDHARVFPNGGLRLSERNWPGTHRVWADVRFGASLGRAERMWGVGVPIGVQIRREVVGTLFAAFCPLPGDRSFLVRSSP